MRIRVVPDIRPFFISSIRPDIRLYSPDIRFHSPDNRTDIRLEKMFKIKNSFDK